MVESITISTVDTENIDGVAFTTGAILQTPLSPAATVTWTVTAIQPGSITVDPSPFADDSPVSGYAADMERLIVAINYVAASGADHVTGGMAGGDAGEGSTTNPPDTKSEVRQRVDSVIGDLMNRDVDAGDRTRLGKALDTANAPDKSVKGQNQAVGRIAHRG